jgi:hypothetical protein
LTSQPIILALAKRDRLVRKIPRGRFTMKEKNWIFCI